MTDENNFVKIDMANVAPPSKPLGPESLSFIQSEITPSPITQSQSYASSYFGNSSAPFSLGGGVNTSRVSGFLKQKGFGWVMEVEQDEDSDANLSLLEELDIQPAQIAGRIRSVLLPLPNHNEKLDTNSPDFWGPLACVVAYALVSALGQFRVLPCILVVWLVGSFVFFIVARGLGAEMTYSLCLGILGYSTLPLALIAIALPAFTPALLVSSETQEMAEEPFSPVVFFLKAVAMFWSTVSAMAALTAVITASGLTNRRPLFAYPLFLFYGYLIALYSGA